jgi:hypothetical protein
LFDFLPIPPRRPEPELENINFPPRTTVSRVTGPRTRPPRAIRQPRRVEEEENGVDYVEPEIVFNPPPPTAASRAPSQAPIEVARLAAAARAEARLAIHRLDTARLEDRVEARRVGARRVAAAERLEAARFFEANRDAAHRAVGRLANATHLAVMRRLVEMLRE